MSLMDEEIKKNVVFELYKDNRVDASNVSVEVNNGEVTLQGELPTYYAFTAAYNNTLKISGVTGVNNQLKVRYPVGTAMPTDAELLSAIESKLFRNPDINIADLNIQVQAGEVVLKGTVDAYWKKVHAEKLASSEPGVVVIKNHLAIVPTRDFVDQDIAEDIIRALESRSVVSANNINVKVSNGEVTLSGTVPDWSARQAAYESAAFTSGVVNVENNITISS
ncbi:MAG: BON domain-containing protein [Desulfonatronovibrio sp.]